MVVSVVEAAVEFVEELFLLDLLSFDFFCDLLFDFLVSFSSGT